jgi:hypothetical protein
MFSIGFTTIPLSGALVVTSAGAQAISLLASTSSLQTQEDLFAMDTVGNPLKPADTSSPRVTLRSFLTDVPTVDCN